MTDPPAFERVAFDCDSTLSAIEGIDELAGERAEEIAALTRRAMEGELPLEAVYGERLRRIAPDREAVARLGERYVACAVPEAREVVAALHDLGKEVCVVSGGVRPALERFARWLGVAARDVYAVELRFDAEGRYAGYAEDSPLARQDGKRVLLGSLPRRCTVLVGDGSTDLAARPAVERFVYFAGFAVRPTVMREADVVVHGRSLAGVLPAVCTPAELERLREDPRHRRVLRARKEEDGP